MVATTVRIFLLAILLATCAPLASLYALVVPFFSKGDEGRTGSSWLYTSKVGRVPGDLVSETIVRSSHLTTQNVLQHSNSTLEEMFVNFLRDHMMGKLSNQHFNLNLLTSSTSSLSSIQCQHWSIVLPWGISVIMSVIVPAIITFLSYMRPEDDDDHINDPWISRTKKYKRRVGALMVAVQSHKKILEELDIDPDEVDNEGVPYWRLSLPGDPGPSTRKVTGVCAVCLGCYVCGDEVVWSSNPKCPHVFHIDCLLSWLVRRREQCPCCRQIFLPKEA